MRIDIDDTWSVESTKDCYIVTKRTITQSGKGTGQEVRAIVGYYGSCEGAFSSLGDRMLRESPAVGVQAVMEAAQDIGRKLGRLMDEARLPRRKVA